MLSANDFGVKGATALADALPLTVDHLPARLGGCRQPAAAAGTPPRRPASLRELELQAIREGLLRNHGNKPKTAEELGISLKTLYNKLHQLQDGGLERTG